MLIFLKQINSPLASWVTNIKNNRASKTIVFRVLNLCSSITENLLCKTYITVYIITISLYYFKNKNSTNEVLYNNYTLYII